MNQARLFTPIVPTDVLGARRTALERALVNGDTMCFFSPMLVFQDIGIPMEYTPSSNIAYLTGYQGPNVALSVAKKDDKLSYTLFTDPRVDPIYTKFYGKVPSKDELQELTKVDEVLGYDKLETLVKSMGNKVKMYGPGDMSPEIDRLRLVKDNFEQDELRKVASLTCKAIEEGMKNVKTLDKDAILESHVRSNIEHAMIMNGARGTSFPTVITNKNTSQALHNIFGNKPLKDGLVVVDAGAKLNSLYSGDVTRVFPSMTTSEFTKEEEEIYKATQQVMDIVVSTLNTAMASKRPISLVDLDFISLQAIGNALHDLGIIKSQMTIPMVAQFQPHSVAHHIGFSVHDCGSISPRQPLKAGNVICIEPGIYLQDTKDVVIPDKYKGISCRIEDMYLIKEDSVEKLSL